MITILNGENSFLVQQHLRQQVRNFVAEHSDMALEQLDGEEAEFDRMREALQSLPFLASKKLVVLRAPGANKQFTEAAEGLLTELPESTDLIIIEPKLDKRTAYFKLLKAQKNFHQYDELDANGLSRWLVAYAQEYGGALGQSDARYLIERVGANQRLLGNELKKLIQYNPNVTEATINLLTDRAPQSTVFELLDSALAGNHRRTLELYQEQRTMKVEPQQILALLGWQLHILAVLKTAGERDVQVIAKEAKLNPYVVRKSQSIARRMSMQDLKQLIKDTLDLDIRLKSESIDADDAIQNLLISIK